MDLKKLMNNGFLIYQQDAKFVLKKLPTPANPSLVLTDDICDDCSEAEFDTFAEAALKADQMCMLGSSPAPYLEWEAQVMYEHKGFGTRITNISNVLGHTPEEAREAARREFEKNMSDYVDEESVEKWDVRIRPAQK
jgi:hypothetical protein